MYILNDLFNGQIDPGCRRVRPGSEYEKTAQQMVELEHSFHQTLTPEQIQAHTTLTALQLQLCAISEEDCFIRGFRIGARMILDVISDYHSQLPQMGQQA